VPNWVVIDFETRSFVDLTSAGSYRYAEDPTTEVLCMSYGGHDGRRGTWWPGDPIDPYLLNAIRAGWFFVCHNCAFERPIWHNHMEPLGWPPIPIAQWQDTMARANQLALPAKLDKVLRALKLTQEKDKEGSKLTIGLSKVGKDGSWPIITPAIRERVGVYCESDIDGQVALHKRIGWLPPHERPIWELATKVNERGLRLDMPLVRAMQKIVDTATAPLAAEFKVLTGGLNFTQIAKIKDWANEQGAGLESLDKEHTAKALGKDIDADEDPLSEPAREGNHYLTPAVRRALEIRQLVGSTSIKKLKSMETCVGLNGRAKGVLRYHGTGPGRQTSHLFQAHNFPRGTLKVDGETPTDPQPLVDALMTGDADYVEALYGPPVEAVVSGLRHILCSDPGRVYLAGDYAGIQARTVLSLAGQRDKTALMAAGADVYIDMAESIYKRKLNKKENPKERQTGKNSVLGLGFQMAGKTFLIKYGNGQDLAFCEEVVRVYRKEWAPLVPKVWYGLQDAAISTVWTGYPHESHGITYRLEDIWLTAEAPNGSKIWYTYPEKETTIAPWSKPGEPEFREGFTYQVEKNGAWVTKHAFGGSLAENIVMKIEREIVERAKKILDANGFPVVLDVHDEIVVEPLLADADEAAFRQIGEDVEQWVKDLEIPIAFETWKGPRYKK
jgi:DNA polymerase